MFSTAGARDTKCDIWSNGVPCECPTSPGLKEMSPHPNFLFVAKSKDKDLSSLSHYDLVTHFLAWNSLELFGTFGTCGSKRFLQRIMQSEGGAMEAPRDGRRPAEAPEQMVWFPVLPAIAPDEASPSSPSADTQDGAVPQRRKSTFPGQAKILQEAQQRYWSQQLKHDSHLSQLKRQYEERIMTNQSQEPQGGPKRQGQASPEQRAQEDNDEASSREIFFVAAIPQGDPATGMLVLPSFEFGYLEARADFWGTSRGAYEAGEAHLSVDSEVHPVRIVPLESRVPEGHVLPRNNGTIYPGSQSAPLSRSNHEAQPSSGPGQKPNQSRPPPPEPTARHGPPVQPQPPEKFTRPQAEGLDQAVPHPVNQGIQEPKIGGVRGLPSGAPASSHPGANWDIAPWGQAASRTHTICLEEATWNQNQGTLPIQEMGFTPTLNGVGNSLGEGELSASAKPRALGSSSTASQSIPTATPVPSMPNTGVEAMRPERPPVKSRRKIITDFCCIFDGSLPEIDTDQVEVLQQVLNQLDHRNVLEAWTRIRPTMTDYYPYCKSLVNALSAENATVRGMYFSPQLHREGGLRLQTFVILEDAQVMANKLPLHVTVQADGETLEVDLSLYQGIRHQVSVDGKEQPLQRLKNVALACTAKECRNQRTLSAVKIIIASCPCIGEFIEKRIWQQMLKQKCNHPHTQQQRCAKLCQDVPSCAKLCQAAPRCAKLCQDVPICAKLCQAVPRCAKLCQALPSSAKLCQDVPSSAKLCQALPSRAKLCQAVPSCAKMCQALPSCAKMCQAVPSSAALPSFAKLCQAGPRCIKMCQAFFFCSRSFSCAKFAQGYHCKLQRPLTEQGA
eukprot:s2195_g1.t3